MATQIIFQITTKVDTSKTMKKRIHVETISTHSRDGVKISEIMKIISTGLTMATQRKFTIRTMIETGTIKNKIFHLTTIEGIRRKMMNFPHGLKEEEEKVTSGNHCGRRMKSFLVSISNTRQRRKVSKIFKNKNNIFFANFYQI